MTDQERDAKDVVVDVLIAKCNELRSSRTRG